MPYELKNVLQTNGTVNANTQIVAPVAGKRIKVTAYLVITTYSVGSLGVLFSDGNAGTTLWPLLLQAQAGGISGANLAKPAPDAIFICTQGTGLWFNPAGQNVLYAISYFADDAY